MKILGLALVYIGMYIVYMASFGADQFEFGAFLLSVLMASPFLGAGHYLIDQAAQAAQAQADDQARSGVVGPFFLYLRPFNSTNVHRATSEHLNFFNMELWERDGYDDIERFIARAVQSTAPLIGFGKPGEHRGAGRIEAPEDNWQAQVAELMKSATFIVAVPSSQPGTLWELRQIATEAYLPKTIFVMPPSDNIYYESKVLDLPEQWEATRARCAAFDLDLPAHSSAGMLFMVETDANVATRKPLPSPDPARWRTTLQELIDA